MGPGLSGSGVLPPEPPEFAAARQRNKVSLKVSCDPTHLSGLSGASGIEELAGILGASITFRLETSPPYENVTWSKMDGNKSINIVKVTFAEPCGHQVSLPAFLNRVNISKDCRELHLSHLKQEDAGRYSAQIVLPKKAELVESFDLQVSSKYPSHVIPDVLPLPSGLESAFCPQQSGSSFYPPWKDRRLSQP
uniref:Uncharacterized protein n=1 Tax=Naja naja TaxID=35670 RepID=A0A8C6YG09_NAJNA